MATVNIAGYKFVELPDAAALRAPIKDYCVALGLKGTILLAPEGINIVLAGACDSIDGFLSFLAQAPQFRDRFRGICIKRSQSARQPFRRMLVRLKKEIIKMNRVITIAPHERAPAVAPQTLCEWLDRGTDDDGRPIVLLDTRNAFEIELGSFQDARQLHLAHFSEFPRAVEEFIDVGRSNLDAATIVTFCTGGIRCEKATLVMREMGVPSVLQLDGGILRYFEEVGGRHWQGECFVFDDRVALNPGLHETATTQCYACRQVVTAVEQQHFHYVRGVSCPHCWVAGAVREN